MTEKTQLWQMWYTLPLTKLLQAFKIAVGPARLVIAMTAVLALMLIGWVMDICSSTVVIDPQQKHVLSIAVPIENFSDATELEVYLRNPNQTKEFIEQYKSNPTKTGLFSIMWNFTAARFNWATVSLLRLEITDMFENIWLFARAITWAISYHFIYSVIYTTLAGAVICVCGGAICRSAALEFTHRGKPGLMESYRFAFKNFVAFLTGPAISLGIVIFFAAIISALGLLANVPIVGQIMLGIGLPGALVFALLTVLMIIGLVAGGGLLFPVIAYEKSDGFDAISRAYSYIFTQPWWMIYYGLISVIYGTLSYLFIRFFAFLVLIITYILINLGMLKNTDGTSDIIAIWPKPEFLDLMGAHSVNPEGLLQSVSAVLIHLTVLFVTGLVVAFVISFVFSISTIVYPLMRNNVDHVELDRVYVQLDEVMDNDRSE